ncbi:MAG: RHS repeat domain-containing protein, partial [Chloroflexota bacterium]|nr:RHS repeat domain-containing protein [Chloroflexota bacterium]
MGTAVGVHWFIDFFFRKVIPRIVGNAGDITESKRRVAPARIAGVAKQQEAMHKESAKKYDAAGNLVSVTNPLSQTTTYTYADSSHLLKDMVLPADRNGDHVTTTFAYYRNHKAFYYANQKGETETLDYDLYRQRTRVTDPRGFIREYQ